MIPSACTNARSVTKPALHFVSDRRGEDYFLAGCANAFGNGKNPGEIIARMRRLLGKISVVVIEIANATSVRERGPVRRRFMVRADDCRSCFGRKIEGHLARDRAGFLVPGANRAAQ